MQYGALLSRAWDIIWRNKIIWVFGFLAGLGTGGANGSNWRTNFNIPGRVPPGEITLPPWLQRFFSEPTLLLVVIVIAVAIVLLIALVLALIAALGHGGMVEMVREADDTGTTGFSTGWGAGLRHVLGVFAIRFLLGLPSVIIILAGLIPFLLTIFPAAMQSARGVPGGTAPGWVVGTLFACFLPALCIGLLAMIPLSLLETLSIRALVLEERGIGDSIRRGWQIFTQNLGQVIVLWLIFAVIGLVLAIVVGLIVAALAVALIVPIALLVVASPLFVIPLVLAALVVAVIGAAIRSVVEAFVSAVWTLAYRQFAAPAAAASAPVPA